MSNGTGVPQPQPTVNIPFSPQQVNALNAFLNRVQLEGKEARAFVSIQMSIDRAMEQFTKEQNARSNHKEGKLNKGKELPPTKKVPKKKSK